MALSLNCPSIYSRPIYAVSIKRTICERLESNVWGVTHIVASIKWLEKSRFLPRYILADPSCSVYRYTDRIINNTQFSVFYLATPNKIMQYTLSHSREHENEQQRVTIGLMQVKLAEQRSYERLQALCPITV